MGEKFHKKDFFREIENQIIFIPIMKGTIRQLQYFLLPYSVLFIIALTLKIIFTREEIYFYVNGLHFPAGDVFFRYATEMGGATTAACLVLILLFVNYRYSLLLASSYLLTSLINFPLKYNLGRGAPIHPIPFIGYGM